MKKEYDLSKMKRVSRAPIHARDAKVKISLEILAEIPSGAPENVVRTVTENCRTLKFDSQGFEDE